MDKFVEIYVAYFLILLLFSCFVYCSPFSIAIFFHLSKKTFFSFERKFNKNKKKSKKKIVFCHCVYEMIKKKILY